jgi:hypothetical protein
LASGIFAVVAYYFFKKMRLNFLIISLAFDHTQILGLLASAKIDWPWQIKLILKWFVLFQLDIDVAGPECMARGLVTFENKWWFKVLVPFLGMAFMLFYKVLATCVECICHCHRKSKKGKNKKLKKSGLQKDLADNNHRTQAVTFMVKAFISIVATCYIMMTKAAMSIFSCYYPPGDDTGASFMVAQPSEPCWQEDGLQYALIAPALVVICAYSFGYPLALWSLYHRYRHIIMRDQVLRAAGKGYSIKTNKDIHFRYRYGILYSYFKPSHYWWVLMFIGRKFFVCSFAVGLRNYPTFQLASMLLVMFLCLLIQVRQRPFMDTRERAQLLIDLNQKKLAYANSMLQHMVMFSRAHHQDLNKESCQQRKMRKRIADFEALINGYKEELLHHDGWWWNLNTLEETLSTGAVILMLTGITFDTTFVKNSPNVRGAIAIVMVILLLAELIFYGMHFAHEYKNVKKVNRKFAKIQWRLLKTWRTHNFMENKNTNSRKIVPAGLASKTKVEDGIRIQSMASTLTATEVVPTASTKAAQKRSKHPESVDDLFDIFDSNSDKLGFDIDDIFDDSNVFDGTANKELDFMNMCMEEKKHVNKTTGKSEAFHLDDFLDQGLSFNPKADTLDDFLFAKFNGNEKILDDISVDDLLDLMDEILQSPDKKSGNESRFKNKIVAMSRMKPRQNKDELRKARNAERTNKRVAAQERTKIAKKNKGQSLDDLLDLEEGSADQQTVTPAVPLAASNEKPQVAPAASSKNTGQSLDDLFDLKENSTDQQTVTPAVPLAATNEKPQVAPAASSEEPPSSNRSGGKKDDNTTKEVEQNNISTEETTKNDETREEKKGKGVVKKSGML